MKRAALELGLAGHPAGQDQEQRRVPRAANSIAPEAIIVVGYGRIIPQWMIDLPQLGNINLHASLLPKYRGAAPIQWAIANGESITGVTTMRIDAGLDTGDILLQAEERIRPEDTALTLASAVGADWCRADDRNSCRAGRTARFNPSRKTMRRRRSRRFSSAKTD